MKEGSKEGTKGEKKTESKKGRKEGRKERRDCALGQPVRQASALVHEGRK